MNQNWQRMHLRAPVYSELLFGSGNTVKSGSCENISEGGLFLLSDVTRNENDVFSAMFLLTTYPDLYSKTKNELFALNRKTLLSSVIRAKVVVRRTMPVTDSTTALYAHGCKFVNITTKEKNIISNYVKRYSRNIVFILNLFEGMNENNSNLALIRSLTRFLGYEHNLKIPFLRQKLLHDYQSLESNMKFEI